MTDGIFVSTISIEKSFKNLFTEEGEKMPRVGFLDKNHISGIKKVVLSNGITVFMEELPERKKAVFLVGIGAGSRDDPLDLQGISHLVEHIQFKSNQFRSAEEIPEDVEDGGGRIHAGTDSHSTVIYIDRIRPYLLSKNIRILYEIISNFEYNTDEIEREKLEASTEIRKHIEDPEEYYLGHLFIPSLLRKTFGEKPIPGNRKTIKKITKEDLVDFKKRFHLPNNMIIIVCGKFDGERVLKKIEGTFGRLKLKPLESREFKISLINRRKEIFKKRKGLGLVYLALGYRTSGFDSYDSLKLMLLDSILSSGMSSRLPKRLTNERGIGYDELQSVYDDYGGIGVFYITVGGFDPRRFKEARNIILKELEDLKTNLAGKREFLRAKNQLLSEADGAMDDLQSRAEWLSDCYFTKSIFDPRNLKKYISKISREAVRRTAQKYFGQNYTLTALVPENFEK